MACGLPAAAARRTPRRCDAYAIPPQKNMARRLTDCVNRTDFERLRQELLNAAAALAAGDWTVLVTARDPGGIERSDPAGLATWFAFTAYGEPDLIWIEVPSFQENRPLIRLGLIRHRAAGEPFIRESWKRCRVDPGAWM